MRQQACLRRSTIEKVHDGRCEGTEEAPEDNADDKVEERQVDDDDEPSNNQSEEDRTEGKLISIFGVFSLRAMVAKIFMFNRWSVSCCACE